MKIIALIGLLIFSIPALAGKEQYSSELWHSFGSYAAIVLPIEDNQEDSRFYGLVFECSPSKGKARISIKDVNAMPGDLIRWKTDKEMGSIANSATLVARTSENDVTLNQRLKNAMKSGSWIKFENVKSGSFAKYTLNGSSKAISSIVSCK